MPKVLKTIWDEFVYGGHLVALGPTIIAYSYMRIKNLDVAWFLLIGIYLITYIIHLVDRYFDIKNDSSAERFQHYRKYRGKIWLMLSLSLLLLIITIVRGGISILLFSIFLIILGILYSLFFKKFTAFITGFKSFYTALAFSSVVFLCSYYYKMSVDITTIFIYLFFASRWFSNTTFCDLKDTKQDRADKLKTFAVVFNSKYLYLFYYFTAIISILIISIGIYLRILPVYTAILLISVLYYFYYLGLSKKPGANYQNLANVWADGESVVWLIAIILGANLWA